MKRAWMGIALLSASWLLGLNYYYRADWLMWFLVVAIGAALTGGTLLRSLARPVALISAALLLPAAAAAPWPYRAALLLTAAGLVCGTLPIPRRWPRRVASASVLAGIVLLAQSVTMTAYESFTARWPDLPRWLARVVWALAAMSGAEVTANGPDLALFTMRRIHALGATWALLVDPASLCFLIGGWVLLAVRHRGRGPSRKPAWRGLLADAGRLLAIVAAWLPVRAAILIAVYLHRALRADAEGALDLMNQFWSPWVHLILLAGPVLLAWRFLAGGRRDEPRGAAGPVGPWWRPAAAAGASLAAVGLLTAAVAFDPVGERKGGRILIDEHRSNLPWPRKTFDTVRTNRPFDTEWWGHDSAYNYAAMYDYCSRFYAMSRRETPTPIDDQMLAGCDVLVLKDPSGDYMPQEIQAIERFVEKGGGLLMIGEHTNIYGSGTYLNRIAERFGFRFRYDIAFGMDSFFDQRFETPVTPHPVIQHMGPLDFAGSCTIDPMSGAGRAVIQSTGLKNRDATYRASNYYPQAENHPDMRYGAFVQLWATRRGDGRVLAFTDSTVFSTFSFFEPGKSELMLGMLEWLNHENRLPNLRWPLGILGILLLAGAVVLAWPVGGRWPLLVAAGSLGWAAVALALPAYNRRAMPPPQALRPMVRVAMDRTISKVHLPRNGFIGGKENEFGLFERSILRLGYFTHRTAGPDLTDANIVVVLQPTEYVRPEFRERLERYVAEGGHLLVVDSPENTASTANTLLQPFGLSREWTAWLKGPITPHVALPAIPVDSALEIRGGWALAEMEGRTVAAAKRHKKGSVWVIGFGKRFMDSDMGITGDVVPGPELRKIHDFEFALFRMILGEQPTTQPTTKPVATAPAQNSHVP